VYCASCGANAVSDKSKDDETIKEILDGAKAIAAKRKDAEAWLRLRIKHLRHLKRAEKLFPSKNQRNRLEKLDVQTRKLQRALDAALKGQRSSAWYANFFIHLGQPGHLLSRGEIDAALEAIRSAVEATRRPAHRPRNVAKHAAVEVALSFFNNFSTLPPSTQS
jgi:hypothetical protein